MLEPAPSSKLLVDIAQSPDSATPFIAHNVENTTSYTQLVPKVTTATDSGNAEILIATLQKCDLDLMPESEVSEQFNAGEDLLESSVVISIETSERSIRSSYFVTHLFC